MDTISSNSLISYKYYIKCYIFNQVELLLPHIQNNNLLPIK